MARLSFLLLLYAEPAISVFFFPSFVFALFMLSLKQIFLFPFQFSFTHLSILLLFSFLILPSLLCPLDSIPFLCFFFLSFGSFTLLSLSFGFSLFLFFPCPSLFFLSIFIAKRRESPPCLVPSRRRRETRLPYPCRVRWPVVCRAWVVLMVAG